MKRFWVASARGCDFSELQRLGFTTFYPALDDYVFLEVTDTNRPLLRRQDELRIKFLRSRKTYDTVGEDELARMDSSRGEVFIPGTGITIIEGHHTGMHGIVESRNGDLLSCRVMGWRKEFQVEVGLSQVVVRGDG